MEYGTQDSPAQRAGADGQREIALPMLPPGHTCPPEETLQRFIEQAVKNCGTAAELSRRLGVTRATVSQWRSRQKHPDVIHFIRIQEIANRRSLLR